MRPSDWIKKVKLPTLLATQRIGLTAISVLGLAVFLFSYFTYLKIPDFPAWRAMKDIKPGPVAVEVEGDTKVKGIYYLPSGVRVREFLAPLGIKTPQEEVILKNGMKIEVRSGEVVKMGKMDASKRLSLDIPVNVNLIREDEFCLIPGVGEKTAKAIVTFRRMKGGRIKNLEELLAVPGIKEKKLRELRKYLTTEDD